MKKLFVILVACAVMASPVYAAQYSSGVNTSGLSDSQEAELALQAREMAAENEAAEAAIPPAERMQEYAEAGQAVAVAFGSCAEELGVAVGDFSRTPVGQVTIFILAWKLVGKDMLKIIVCPVFLLVGTWMWSRYFKKMCLVESIEYHEDGKVKKATNHNPDKVCGIRFIMLVVITIVWGAGLIIMLV